MKKILKRFYFPQTVAYPKLARAWLKKRSYRQRVQEVCGEKTDIIQYTLPARSPAVAGKTFCFLSDFHYMGTPEDLACRRECIALLKAVKPDMLLLGGDLCGDAVALPELPGLLAELGAIAPVTLAVPGNWERRKNWLSTSYWKELYKKSNILFLNDEVWENESCFIYGTDDFHYGTPPNPPEYPDKLTILLTHEPDMAVTFGHIGRLKGLDLILAGHTHGGQVRFPLLGPLRLPSMYGTRFDYGLYENKESRTRLIITSGMGHLSFPARFNCKREIVVIRFAPNSANGMSEPYITENSEQEKRCKTMEQ